WGRKKDTGGMELTRRRFLLRGMVFPFAIYFVYTRNFGHRQESKCNMFQIKIGPPRRRGPGGRKCRISIYVLNRADNPQRVLSQSIFKYLHNAKFFTIIS
ncbi:MAG: hypothetical protein ABIK12_10180, partial [Pseudomonadota bacterium]